MKWTVIVAAPDCSSVQSLKVECDDPQEAVDSVFLDADWLDGFELIAVVAGHQEIYTRDDSATSERRILR